MRGALLRGITTALFAVALWSAMALAQAPGESPGGGRDVAQRTPQLVAASIVSYEGLPVKAVSLRGLNADPVVRERLESTLAQKAGEVLDREKVRQSIQDLFATGRFFNVKADVTRTASGIELAFIVENNFFVGAVTMTGAPRRPPANQLINATKLQLGELYVPEKVENAVATLKVVLADNGFYQANVTVGRDFRPDTQIVDLHFYVEPNAQARVGQVAVEGDSGLSALEIQKVTKLRTGDRVSAPNVTRALVGLRKRYQSDRHLEAQVALAEKTYHPETNKVEYLFRVDRGRIVELRVEGAKVSQGVLKKYVPIFEESAVDDDLLNEGRRNLRDYFQTEGYFDVKVDFEKRADRENNRLLVVYKVDRGERRKLAKILVQGNRYFDRATIEERMSIRAASGFLAHGRFSQSMLAHDAEAIENLYKSNGFSAVSVKTDVQTPRNGNGEGDDMLVTFNIEEGAQTRVQSLTITGNKTFPGEALMAMLSTVDGQPFSDVNVSTDRDSLISYYFNHGFPDVQLEVSAKRAASDPTKVDVTYNIREGEQVFVDRVVTFGTAFTRPYVVQRELSVREGKPLSQGDIVDSQRSLYDLQIFNEVNVAVQNPDGRAKYKDVLFEMREARRWTFNYGFGLEIQAGGAPKDVTELNTSPGPGVSVPPNSTPVSNTTLNNQSDTPPTVSPRFTFELTRLNFRGRNHTLNFSTHVGRLQQRALFSYDAPRWMDKKNLRITFSTFYDNSRDVRTFTSERLEGSVQAEQGISKATTLLYRFQFRRVSVDPNSLAISPELVPLLSQPVRVGMPSFTYIRDRRDDPIDSHRGTYTTFDTGVAAKAFGSETNFGRFLVQNSSYTPLGRKGWVFARMTRIGVSEPFNVSATFPSDTNPIPLPERFFGGGSNSHRGFALNQAGPRDLTTGFPIGGNAIFVNSLELRTRPGLFAPAGNALSFVLFHDMGNVFETGQEMVKGIARWHQPNIDPCLTPGMSSQCNFNYSSHATGLGARYRTPIGPVRVDLSYNLNPPRFPFFVQCAPLPLDSNGNPKPVKGDCAQPYVDPTAANPELKQLFRRGTLSRWNFFFSIGQTF